MLGLRETLSKLARLRHRLDALLALADQHRAKTPGTTSAGRLREIASFGSNPGRLCMFAHAPPNLPHASALVVALHGCTQSAADYDYGSGWSTLADRLGFALLCPQQQRANNSNVCFTWFHPAHTQRGRGEALSIWQMIERMIGAHGIDRSRVFIVGLSAGGAMTAVMLAAYPEVFAGGAIIAGLPSGGAGTLQDALQIMTRGSSRSPQQWGDLIRSASSHRGPWPKLSVWHGSADNIVNPTNAEEIVKQWTNVHGLAAEADLLQRVQGHERRSWRNAAGVEVIEAYTISGMGHGVPLQGGQSADHCGHVGAFHLDVGLSSSLQIAKFWALASERARTSDNAATVRPRPMPLPLPEATRLGAKTLYSGQSSAAQDDAQAFDASAAADKSCAGAQDNMRDPRLVVTAVLRGLGLLIPPGSKPSGDPRSIIASTLRAVGVLKE